MDFLAVVFQDYEIFAATLGENISLTLEADETGVGKGGLDITCVSCYGVINGGILKKSKSGIDRTEEMAYY